MPPVKLTVRCQDCSSRFTAYAARALSWGDSHADKHKHMLLAYRPDKTIYCEINPAVYYIPDDVPGF